MRDRLKHSKYIRLEDGRNWRLIFGILVCAVVFIVCATSKLWLPDDRANLSSGKDYDVTFAMCDLHIEDYYIDYGNGLAELHFTQSVYSDEPQYALTYRVVNDSGDELPFTLIEGGLTPVSEDSALKKRNVILQFGIYEGLYYVKAEITQEATQTQSVIMDYRGFISQPLTEKAPTYLTEMEEAV